MLSTNSFWRGYSMGKISEKELNTVLSIVKSVYLSESKNSGNLLQNLAAGSFSAPDGDNIVARNSKRKNGKVEFKKIPISKMLTPFVTCGIGRQHGIKALRYQMKKILPDHILYDLRTTFYTRLKECGVADNAINEYVGHSLGTLGNTYTDLSDEYLLREGEKYIY